MQSVEESYVRAGAIAGAYVAGLAAASPLLGRLVDRIGPRRVLLACAVLYPSMLLLLIYTVLARAPAAITPAVAALAGASFPPVTACQRAWLRQTLGDDPLLTAALSLDALVVELVFILGPLAVALIVAYISPAAAVAAAALCGFLGSLQFVRARALRTWRLVAGSTGALLGPLVERRFLSLLGLVTCYASVFGLVEIGVTAFAAEAGQPALAGLYLGVMSVGSAAGALAYGSRNWDAPLARQFRNSLVVMGVGIAPLALVTHPGHYALASLIAGVAMTPTLIIQATLVVRTVSSRHATEGFTWSATALLAGVGIGLVLGGLILEHGQVGTLFWFSALISAGSGLLAHIALRV